MGIDVGNIRSGLMRFKQFLSSSAPKQSPLRVQSIANPPSIYAMSPNPVPAAPPSSGLTAFYLPSGHIPRRNSVAPPPNALPSLSHTGVTSFYANDPVDDKIHELLDDSNGGSTGSAPKVGNGTLSVIADLEVYEEFLRGDTDISSNPVQPANFRALANSLYGLEQATSGHRSAHLLELLIVYFRNHYIRNDSPITFTEFITSLSEQDLMAIWTVPCEQQNLEYVRRFKQGVRYLESSKREKYNVTSKVSGELFWEKWKDGPPLDTKCDKFFERKHSDTMVLEKDKIAIWVLSKDDKLYTHPGKLHRFHHSSFMSGDVVRCAGDWEVKNGKLQWISAASGHYQPTHQNLANAIQILSNKFSVSATTYTVKVFETKDVNNVRTKSTLMIPANKFLLDLPFIESKYTLV